MASMIAGRPLLPALLLAATCLLLPESALALRCNGQIVGEGDPEYEVRDACGAPDHVLPLYGHGDHAGHPRAVLWYYNFGPGRLLRELRFRDGRLRAIRTPGRGFRVRDEGGPCWPNDLFRSMTGYELLATCGEPVQREARSLLRPQRRNGKLLGYRRAWVEDWFYDLGGGYIDRRVRLVDGRVTEVETVD